MGHARSPQADSDLDSIWYHVAIESGSVEIADRLIDSIAERFLLIANYPISGAAVTLICALDCGVFPWANMSSFIASKMKTF